MLSIVFAYAFVFLNYVDVVMSSSITHKLFSFGEFHDQYI